MYSQLTPINLPNYALSFESKSLTLLHYKIYLSIIYLPKKQERDGAPVSPSIKFPRALPVAAKQFEPTH